MKYPKHLFSIIALAALSMFAVPACQTIQDNKGKVDNVVIKTYDVVNKAESVLAGVESSIGADGNWSAEIIANVSQTRASLETVKKALQEIAKYLAINLDGPSAQSLARLEQLRLELEKALAGTTAAVNASK